MTNVVASQVFSSCKNNWHVSSLHTTDVLDMFSNGKYSINRSPGRASVLCSIIVYLMFTEEPFNLRLYKVTAMFS
jgi:hypothetical protein